MIFSWLIFILLHPNVFAQQEMVNSDGESMSETLPSQTGSHCGDLHVGKPLDVKIPKEESPTHLPAFYQLVRNDKSTYTVILDIRFVEGAGYNGPPGTLDITQIKKIQDLARRRQVINEYYRKRMINCFNDPKFALKDPRGIKLNLQLAEPDPNKIPIAIEVVSSAEDRSNSAAYKSDVDCETITHEALHLLFLVDEYPEPKIKTISEEEALARGFDPTQVLAYDCRSLGPEGSVMHSPHTAFMGPTYEMNSLFCVCSNNVASSACDPSLYHPEENPEDRHCPPEAAPAQPGITRSSAPYSPASEPPGPRPFMTLEWGPPKFVPAPPTLSVAKMNVILQPGCRRANQVYYACAENAYRSSEGHGGEGCREVPPACQQPNWGLK